MCECPNTLSRAEARRIAGYLHTINALAVGVRRGELPKEKLGDIGDLVTAAMNPLLDIRGQTDFYGNPTHSCAIREAEERMLNS